MIVNPENLPYCACGEPSMFLAMNNEIAIYYCEKCGEAKDYEVKMIYKEPTERQIRNARSIVNDKWITNLRTTDEGH